MKAPEKVRIDLPHDPATLPLAIYPKNLKRVICTDVCTLVFTAALGTVAKTWSGPCVRQNTPQTYEKMKYRHLQQHGWLLNYAQQNSQKKLGTT